jgi:hypothetical protein
VEEVLEASVADLLAVVVLADLVAEADLEEAVLPEIGNFSKK